MNAPTAAAPSTLTIRRARSEDVGDIVRIDEAVYPSTWSESMTLQQVEGPDRVHLSAVVDDVVVGHAGILLLAGEGHISTIAVDPAAQRTGIGRSLLLTLMRSAIAEGCTAVTLEVRASNRAALSLYRSFGLAPAGIRRAYYADTGEDALVLWSPELSGAYADRIRDMAFAPHVQVAFIESEEGER